MAKAEALGKNAGRGDGTGSSFRDYTSLLGVVAAGFLGISLLCITSAIALSAPNAPTPLALEPASIVDLAVNNVNTIAALTVQVLSEDNESTPFLLPSKTPTASPTATVHVNPTFTQRAPTRTRAPRIPSTSTPMPPPTKTAIPPTQTNIPPTTTPIPSDTNTPVPDTNTPVPDTNTPVPDTNTPIPDTNTPVPDPNTPPADTNTPGAVAPISEGSPAPGP